MQWHEKCTTDHESHCKCYNCCAFREQKNASLEILDVSWNGMAHTGTVALAQAIRVNKTLRVLDIRSVATPHSLA